MTTLAALTDAAAPWVRRPERGRDTRVVDTADRADLVVLDQILTDCPALETLQHRLTDRHGAVGLVQDLWMAAYSRTPQLLDAHEVEPSQRRNRAIAAAMLGTPEHTALRRMTVGDAYAAAMSVLAQAKALPGMLDTLDPAGRHRAAARRHRGLDAAARWVEHAHQRASDSVDADPDAAVAQPKVAAMLRAIAEAEQAEDAVAAAEQAVAEENGNPALAVSSVRAAARQAAADAEDALVAEDTAMTAWGVGEGQLQHLDAQERMRLARSLQSGKLARFAELIGRFRTLSHAQRARRVEHARGEYVGVALGDDLGGLVPEELANLAVPGLRAAFLARYVEAQLMVYDQRGEEHQAQGSIIACIDCSSSMRFFDEHGISGEAYAKAMALALLDQARAARPRRGFAAILFSHHVEPPILFPADQPLDLAAQLRMAERFPGGGTDFQAPLDAAVALLEAEFNSSGRPKADIVFLTDGAAELSEDWVRAWRRTKHRLGFRCYGVQLPTDGGPWAEAGVLEDICDDVRAIADLSDVHGTAGLFRAI